MTSYTPASTNTHPFGQEEEVSRQQLFVAFCNHLHLGQWELVRACGQTLLEKYGEEGAWLEPEVRKVLEAVVEHPFDCSLASESVPSAHHLAWLALQEHRNLTTDLEERLPHSLSTLVEFRLLLHSASEYATVAIIQDVYNLFIYIQDITKAEQLGNPLSPNPHAPSITDKIRAFLKVCLQRDTHPGHAIINHLRLPTSSRRHLPHNQSLQEVYLDCLTEDISALRQAPGNREKLVARVYKVLSLMGPSRDMEDLQLESLFLNLLDLTKPPHQLLRIQSLYSSLLGRGSAYLIRELCRIEGQERIQELNAELKSTHLKLDMLSQELRITLRLAKMENRELAWKEMFQQALSRERHVLANVLDTCMTLIRDGMHSELVTLLSPDEFAPLKPLVLLLGWNHVSSCDSANRLLEALYVPSETNSVSEPLLDQACGKLTHQVQLVQWCLEKTRPFLLASGVDPGFDPKASEMFCELDSRSVLHMLHHATNLSQLDSAEVFDILSKKPQLDVKSEEVPKSSGKSVHFEEPQQLSIQQERDIAIYRSFLAIKSCMTALSNSTQCRKPREQSNLNKQGVSLGASRSAPALLEPEDSKRTGNTSLTPHQPHTSQGDSGRSASKEAVDDSAGSHQVKSWEKDVLQHLREARHQLSLLYPLTYRVETLENIFSLLFTRSEDAFVRKAAMSDSGGEEGIVDEEWQNKSVTSLESTPKNEHFTFNLGAELLPVGLSSSDSKLLDVQRPAQDEMLTESVSTGVMESLMSADKRDRTSSGSIVAKRSNTERSSESHSQHSSNSLGPVKICFVADEDIIDALLSTLKECLADLAEARYSLAGPSASVEVLQEAGGRLMKYMHCSVSTSTMAQRISQLTQRVNEAWWRYRLVSQATGSQNASQGSANGNRPVRDSSSDDELYMTGFHGDKDDKRGDKVDGDRKRRRSRVSSLSGKSGSDGSTSSSKRRKRRRRQKSTSKAPTSERGVVARMLSAQDTLLRMCLHRGSYAQALQVVKMFELEDTPEVSEVYFAEHWEQTLRRLQNIGAKAAKTDPTSCVPKVKPSGSSSSIASIAASGAASLSVSGVVDDLLATSVLPLLPTAPLVGADQHEKHSTVTTMLRNIQRLNIAGVVVFDLACSACKSWKASKNLLEVAKGRLQLGHHSPGEFDQSFKPRLQSQPNAKVDPLQLLVGILPFVHQMTNLISPTSADATALIRQDIMEEFFQRSASDALLQATKPLDAIGLRAHVNLVLEQRKAVLGLSRALQAESNKRTPGSSGSAAQDLPPSEMDHGLKVSPKGRSVVHQAMRQLLQTFDKCGNHCYSLTALLSTTGLDHDAEYSNYLMSLYAHVSVLSSLLVEAKEWHLGLDQPVPCGSMKAVNPYCVLEESPNFLLGRLMFQNQIPPVRLEGVADQLKLNLVHVIVRSCCPAIPMHIKPDRPPRPQASAPKGSLYRIVLNDPGEGMEWSSEVRHPEVVARDLLSKMIMLMKGHATSINPNGHFGLRASVLASSSKDFQALAEATRELAYVDLDQLECAKQRLCFFANVMNLMLAHASLHHIYQQLICKDVTLPCSGHTRHSSLTERLHLEDVVTLPGTSSRQIIERITYLNKMAYRIGQLGVVSAFELRYIILRPGLHPPSCFNHILLHRLHALNVEDPWHRYLPPAETRLLFVISNGCRVSPALQVLKVNNVEEQLELAMQQFLENYVIVNDEKLRVTIPKQLDWFRKDFTGKSLGTDIEQGHIYGGLLNVVAPHMSKQLGEKLESFVLSCQPGKIQLEEKPSSPGLPLRPKLHRGRSFNFTVRIEPYDFSYGYKFEYRSASKMKKPILTHRRSSSQPDGLLGEVPVRNFECLSRPTFSMTESTLAYLHSKSKLVASLAGLVSMSVDDRPDRFALKKSVESSGSLGSSFGSPMSLVFDEGAFGEDREFLPDVTTSRKEMAKMAQHVIGYSAMQRYLESYMSNIIETAETLQNKASSLQIPEGHPANNVALTMRNAHACTLANLHSDHYQAMVYFSLDHLITYSKWTDALHLIHSLPNSDALGDWLPNLSGIQDFVLCCAAQADLPGNTDELLMSDSWRALMCLRDKDLCARVTLGLLPRLPVAVGQQLLEHCVANPASEASLKEAVAFKLDQMKTYSKITEYAQANDSSTTFDLDTQDESHPDAMLTSPSPYIQWQQVASDSLDNPHAVLGVLLAARDFELAKEWAVLHDVYQDLKETIHEKHLLHLLSDSSNTLMAYQILEQIGDQLLCLRICRSLLEAQGERISLASTVFLVQFMMDHFLDLMAMEQVEELQALSLGAKALLCLPEPERSDCEHLVSKPMLILEQLLMNTKIEHASMVVDCLRRELLSTHFRPSDLSLASCDVLVTKYAKNAILLVAAVQSQQSDFESTLRSVSAQSVTSPTGQRRSRSRMSITSLMATLSPSPASSLSSQSVPVARDRAPSPTPSTHSVSRGLSPRGQSTLVGTTPRRVSVSSNVVSMGGSAEPRTGASFPPPSIKEDVGLPAAPPKREDWVPDLKVTHCMVCKEERFSMFNRRHHCRRCGHVVCWRCSQLKAVVEGYGDAPVRVCDHCYQTFIMPRPQQSNMSSLEQRLKAKQPGSRHSPVNRASSPGSWQHRTPVAGTSLTSAHSGGADTLLMAGMEWQLTLDDVYNALIREDFYYEQAPSTSVCLSILDLHSDHSTCGTLILQICRDLSEYLRPIRPGVPNPEVDYNLIISMMKTLLFNAKLRFIKDGDSSSIELCDSYRSFVDLLSLFVRSNSADIPSIQQLANADSARQVRDRLVLAERLSLATEVSTKCGLDSSAVWSAWGMSCLRAGDYQGAREKFARILKAPIDKNVMSAPSKLVTDVIQYLETSASQADTAQAILNASAASIRDFIAEPTNASFSATALDNPALQECQYYITTYCPHISMVQFYRRHSRLSLAVSYILSQHCSTEVFLEGLLAPCMKHGNLKGLQTEMLNKDPTLVSWSNYLTATCRYLNAHSLAHVLYNVQLFMKDFVRASMTCIKFYQSGAKTYSDLFDRLQYLTKAKEHMRAVLDEKQWESVPRPPMTNSTAKGGAPSWAPASDVNIRLMMSPSQLTNHMNTISQQIEVTKFLHRMSSSGKASLMGSSQGAESSSQQLPTLFGNSKVKAEVAYRVLLAGQSVNDGFQMAFQIIQDFRLPDTLIYSHIGRRLATQHKYKDIHQLLTCVRNTGLSNNECCDEILDACVRVLASDTSQTKEVEALIKLIKSDTNKINALMLCGKLKSAYLIAVKAERVEDVQRILSAAQRAGPGQAQMKTICESWLASQAEKRKREMKAKELLTRGRQERR